MTRTLPIVDIQNDYFPGGAVHAAFLAALADSYATVRSAAEVIA